MVKQAESLFLAEADRSDDSEEKIPDTEGVRARQQFLNWLMLKCGANVLSGGVLKYRHPDDDDDYYHPRSTNDASSSGDGGSNNGKNYSSYVAAGSRGGRLSRAAGIFARLRRIDSY